MRRRELLKGLLGSLLSGQVLPQAIAKTAPVVPEVTEIQAVAVMRLSFPFSAGLTEQISQNFLNELMRAEDEKFIQFTVLDEIVETTETPTIGTLGYGTNTDIEKPLAVEF